MASVQEVAEQQRHFWNGPASEGWIRDQEQRDAAIAPLGQLAMAALDLAPGQRVMDIGCGCGGSSLEIAEKVGPQGYVLGIDISEPMLARAEQRRQDEGVAQITFSAADAGSAALPGAPFDAVFSRFGVMFFADPGASFRHIRAHMTSGGRLSFVCWRRVDENPWVNLARLEVLKHVPPPPALPAGAPGQFSFADAERVTTILTEAGFRDIRLTPEDRPFTVSPATDMDKVIHAVMHRGPASRLLQNADDATITTVAEALKPVLQPHMTPNGLILGSAVWIVTARNGE